MTAAQKIQAYRKQADVTFQQLSEYTHIGYTTLITMANKEPINSQIQTVKTICDHMRIGIDDFIDDSLTLDEAQARQRIAGVEKELLDAFRSLPPEEQYKEVGRLQTLSELRR